VTKLVFDLLPTSYQFKKGHRIRVALAGGVKDHFATLPEENLVLTVLRSELYSSRVDLPVVE
jgi:hypothetical protein